MKKLIFLLKKKKTLLQRTSKNKFCVIIFKSPKLASYFYHKNNPSLFQKLFLYERFRYFEIEKERVTVNRDELPGDLNWQHMHLTLKSKIKDRILGIILFVLFLGGGSAGWYGIFRLNLSLINNNSSLFQYFHIIVAVVCNFILLVMEKIMLVVSEREQRIDNSLQSLTFVWKMLFININILYVSPIIIFYFNDYSLIWKTKGLI